MAAARVEADRLPEPRARLAAGAERFGAAAVVQRVSIRAAHGSFRRLVRPAASLIESAHAILSRYVRACRSEEPAGRPVAGGKA